MFVVFAFHCGATLPSPIAPPYPLKPDTSPLLPVLLAMQLLALIHPPAAIATATDPLPRTPTPLFPPGSIIQESLVGSVVRDWDSPV